MDMDRMKFLLSDLLRVRIEKIERYWMHLTTTMNEDEMVQRMSIGEVRTYVILENISHKYDLCSDTFKIISYLSI